MMWAWDPVLLDCHGAPEAAVHYEVREMSGRQASDADGNPLPMTVTLLSDFYTVDASAAATFDPQPGEVEMLETLAIDEAGNTDEGVCL